MKKGTSQKVCTQKIFTTCIFHHKKYPRTEHTEVYSLEGNVQDMFWKETFQVHTPEADY
jgi:hypothetical protein